MFSIADYGLASKILTAVSLAASDDETRPQMNSLLFRVRSNVLDIVATNGHVLAHYNVALDGETPAADCEVLIPLDVVQKVAKASKKAHTVQIDPDARTVHVLPENIQFSWSKIDAQFPPFEQVIPGPETAKARADGFAISAEYLIFAGKVFSTLATDKKGGLTGVHFELTCDALGPIVLSSASIPNLVVVVMPNRSERGPKRRVEKPLKKAA